MHWFIDPIRDHYADFDGRLTRKPFWLFILIYIIISSILDTVTKAMGLEFISWIFSLALFVPSIAITTRRLHDTSRSGWWQLLWIIPVIGWIILIVFLAQDSASGDNEYGPNPKTSTTPVPATLAASETPAPSTEGEVQQ